MSVDGLRIAVVGGAELARTLATELEGFGAATSVVGSLASPADTGVDTPLDAVVFAPWDRRAIVGRALIDLTDEEFGQAWQETMDTAVSTCVEARRRFAGRAGNIVLTFPTIALVGGASHAHWAAAAEGVHILARSVARQWGPEGITVNALALDPALVLADPAAAGPVSIATPARPGARPAGALAFLCSAAARDLAGQTLTVDGGLWM